MEQQNIHNFKDRLSEEKKTLETELEKIGQKNPSNKADWEARPDATDISPADKNEMADHIESYEDNTAILKELEARFNNVTLALQKIKDGTFGICEIGKEQIEAKRLEANPAARTCVKHINDDLE